MVPGPKILRPRWMTTYTIFGEKAIKRVYSEAIRIDESREDRMVPVADGEGFLEFHEYKKLRGSGAY